MKLKVITPEKLILDQEVDSVTLPGSEGQMTILPGHAAMTALLKEGPFYTRIRGQASQPVTLGEGMVEVFQNQVTVMTKGWQISESGPSPH